MLFVLSAVGVAEAADTLAELAFSASVELVVKESARELVAETDEPVRALDTADDIATGLEATFDAEDEADVAWEVTIDEGTDGDGDAAANEDTDDDTAEDDTAEDTDAEDATGDDDTDVGVEVAGDDTSDVTEDATDELALCAALLD